MLLITGASGQLGQELVKLLPRAIGVSSKQLDITDFELVQKFAREYKISKIINCAAYAHVDQAEVEAEKAWQVNYLGALNLAKTGAEIIHISTDYVFDGKQNKPYVETDQVNPSSVYGKTKLAGEKAVLETAKVGVVIRTSWLYSSNGSNFVKTMLRLGASQDVVKVVADQYGSPTYAVDLAVAIKQILSQKSASGALTSGLYHFANQGVCSWFEFASEIMRSAGLNCKVVPIAAADYVAQAPRPSYSGLSSAKGQAEFGLPGRPWQQALEEYLQLNGRHS